jgi:DNA-binding NtrC family response regulator
VEESGSNAAFAPLREIGWRQNIKELENRIEVALRKKDRQQKLTIHMEGEIA